MIIFSGLKYLIISLDKKMTKINNTSNQHDLTEKWAEVVLNNMTVSSYYIF